MMVEYRTLVHAASGALVGSSIDPIMAPPGYVVIQGLKERLTEWWNGAAVVPREPATVTLTPALAVAGETVKITAPPGAWFQMPDGSLTQNTSFVAPSNMPATTIILAGRYKGDASLLMLADLPALKAKLQDDLDRRRETMQMTTMSTGGAKKFNYAMKYTEWRDADALLVAAFNALGLVKRLARFPFIMEAAIINSGKADPSFADFQAAAKVVGDAAVPAVRMLGRIDQRAINAKAAVRAAKTADAARAAAAVKLED